MTNCKPKLCLAAFTLVAAFSGLARADDYAYPVVALNEARAEDRSAEPVGCAQAVNEAWFIQQMDLSDGGNDAVTQTPAECQRELVAAYEESK